MKCMLGCVLCNVYLPILSLPQVLKINKIFPCDLLKQISPRYDLNGWVGYPNLSVPDSLGQNGGVQEVGHLSGVSNKQQ